MAEDLLEAEAIEEPAPEAVDRGEIAEESVRALPEPRRGAELDVWRDDVRTAAVAAAGGIVAGVAAVAAVNVARTGARYGLARALGRRRRDRNVIASRSFLIDVHVLGR